MHVKPQNTSETMQLQLTENIINIVLSLIAKPITYLHGNLYRPIGKIWQRSNLLISR